MGVPAFPVPAAHGGFRTAWRLLRSQGERPANVQALTSSSEVMGSPCPQDGQLPPSTAWNKCAERLCQSKLQTGMRSDQYTLPKQFTTRKVSRAFLAYNASLNTTAN